MVEKISYIPQQPISPIGETQKIASRAGSAVRKQTEHSIPFGEVLEGTIAAGKEIKFSGHAQQRLKMRNIEFSDQQMERITNAIDRAADKGARDSLLLVDNVAAVVSVENRTVITVVEGNSLKDNVFTNIDSAVIA